MSTEPMPTDGRARHGGPDSYCRAIVLPDPGGDWIFVSGTTGFDYATGQISPDPAEQTAQTLRNIGDALAAAGAGIHDVYLYRTYVRDADVWPAVAAVTRPFWAAVRPSGTSLIGPAMDPRIHVEIEVQARRRPTAGDPAGAPTEGS